MSYPDIYSSAPVTIDPLYALNVTDVLLGFGNVSPGAQSANITQNVTNIGNQRINVSVYGYGRIPGDNYSFTCETNNISIGLLKFAWNITATYAVKENLSGVAKPLRVIVPAQTTPTVTTNISYWQAGVPDLFPDSGQCNGTIVFHADLS